MRLLDPVLKMNQMDTFLLVSLVFFSTSYFEYFFLLLLVLSISKNGSFMVFKCTIVDHVKTACLMVVFLFTLSTRKQTLV